MEIGKLFNESNFEEYFFFIDHYKKYTDFNTLGLYRSLVEHEKLSIAEKITIRDYAHKTFQKAFDFLQIKDPATFFQVSTIGIGITKGDEAQMWKDIIFNQQKILAGKRIKDRNFGSYSKHNCGQDGCIYNGLMTKKGSTFAEHEIHFPSDELKYPKKMKSEKRKVERKNEYRIVRGEFEAGLDLD